MMKQGAKRSINSQRRASSSDSSPLINFSSTLSEMTNFFSPQNLDQEISSLSTEIKDLSKEILQTLKNKTAIKSIEKSFESALLQLPKKVRGWQKSLKSQQKLPNATNNAPKKNSTFSKDDLKNIDSVLKLVQVAMKRPEMNAIFQAANIGKITNAISKDKEALNGLARICTAIEKSFSTIMKNEAFAALVAAGFKSIDSPLGNSEKEKRLVKDISDLVMKIFKKTNANTINTLLPLKNLQLNLVKSFETSALLKAMLSDPKTRAALVARLQRIKDTSIYQAFKASSDSMREHLDAIENKIINNALKDNVVSLLPIAGATAVATGFWATGMVPAAVGILGSMGLTLSAAAVGVQIGISLAVGVAALGAFYLASYAYTSWYNDNGNNSVKNAIVPSTEKLDHYGKNTLITNFNAHIANTTKPTVTNLLVLKKETKTLKEIAAVENNHNGDKLETKELNKFKLGK